MPMMATRGCIEGVVPAFSQQEAARCRVQGLAAGKKDRRYCIGHVRVK